MDPAPIDYTEVDNSKQEKLNDDNCDTQTTIVINSSSKNLNDNTDILINTEFNKNTSRDLVIEADQPPAISTLDICKKCPHSHLLINTETQMCAAIVCYTCCISAIVSAVIFTIVCIIAMFKDGGGNGGSGHHHYGLGYSGHGNYYPMLIYYNLDPIIINSKPKVSVDSDNEVSICCCQMEVPHTFEIKCKNCGEILKKGFKRGSLILSIFLGLTLISLFSYLTYIIIRGH